MTTKYARCELIPFPRNKDTKVRHETCQILVIVSKLIFLNMNEKGSPKDGAVRWREFVSSFLGNGIIPQARTT
ncbi:MAG: hypothetical protein KR126chlam2_00220 [Chlamydiae bacterium]|nr:hypothetical protein [Chlamydiota bacterium]